jgi:hypothetical protein
MKTSWATPCSNQAAVACLLRKMAGERDPMRRANGSSVSHQTSYTPAILPPSMLMQLRKEQGLRDFVRGLFIALLHARRLSFTRVVPILSWETSCAAGSPRHQDHPVQFGSGWMYEH